MFFVEQSTTRCRHRTKGQVPVWFHEVVLLVSQKGEVVIAEPAQKVHAVENHSGRHAPGRRSFELGCDS